ncbi:hypothetical protein PIROE2DRAFT_6720 [Piromyces sp. E2]|nr:hypothetical protein PIROE2DRAFT_6720 [Piromyces sp. E2]|eukprot:OUM66107.1 hypothetical protein PIROE2DRAFT_6720 [Piromyces sp. E2]
MDKNSTQEQSLKKRNVQNKNTDTTTEKATTQNEPPKKSFFEWFKSSILGFIKQFKMPKVYQHGALGGIGALTIMYVSAKYLPFKNDPHYLELMKTIRELPLYSLIIIGAIPPILEEVVCRKLIFGNLKKYSKILAYVLANIVFTIGHYNFSIQESLKQINSLPTYFVAGLLLTFVYDNDGHLLSSMIAHFINNVGIPVLYHLGLWV